MARYIDADKLLKTIEIHSGRNFKLWIPQEYEWLIKDIKNAPTADVQEVCRCEKCKYHITHTCAITGIETLFCDCGVKPVAVEPTHFCGYGERRTDNDL
jgi:hypothetical protein